MIRSRTDAVPWVSTVWPVKPCAWIVLLESIDAFSILAASLVIVLMSDPLSKRASAGVVPVPKLDKVTRSFLFLSSVALVPEETSSKGRPARFLDERRGRGPGVGYPICSRGHSVLSFDTHGR